MKFHHKTRQHNNTFLFVIMLLISIILSLQLTSPYYENQAQESPYPSPTQTPTPTQNKIIEIPIIITDSDITFEKQQNYDFINLKDSYYAYSPGMPNLPRKTFQIKIPNNYKISSLYLTNQEYQEINNMNIIPTAQIDLSQIYWDKRKEELELIYKQQGYPGEIKPNPSVYSSDNIFPQQILYYDVHFENNEKIAKIRLAPILFKPLLKKILIIKKAIIKIELEESSEISSSIAPEAQGDGGGAGDEIQIPEIEWEKTFGGIGRDFAFSMQITSDNGFILAGETRTGYLLTGDAYLIKTDSNGNKIFEKKFGQEGEEVEEVGSSVIQTSNNEYVIVGLKESLPEGITQRDIYLLKTDSNGNKIFEKTYGSTQNDMGMEIAQVTDGGYIITGQTLQPNSFNRDVYLLKVDSNGNKLWEKTFGGSGEDLGVSIQQTTDRGYIIVGNTDSFGAGSTDFYLIKTDSNGNKLWEKTYGGELYDAPSKVYQVSDGGYIMFGIIGGTNPDFYLIKTDSQGNKQWEKVYGTLDEPETGVSLDITSDGGYIMTGFRRLFANREDIYIVKADSNGEKEWEKTIDGGRADLAYSIHETSDRGYIIAGHTRSKGAGQEDAYLVKLKGTAEQDSDNDGIADSKDPCPTDDDCDDDGLTDGNTGTEDLNANGVVDAGETDPTKFDTDNDGISDGVERGLTSPEGQNTDMTKFIPDLDPSTTTDPINSDTDGDGISDGIEDSNHNGKLDIGETNSNNPDTDGDGVFDNRDNCPVISNPNQLDSDGNGIGNACEVKFVRGDVNTDTVLDVSDPVKILLYLFAGAQINCQDSADTNDDGRIDISDAGYLLNFLFKNGSPPRNAFPAVDLDPTDDTLTCQSYPQRAQQLAIQRAMQSAQDGQGEGATYNGPSYKATTKQISKIINKEISKIKKDKSIDNNLKNKIIKVLQNYKNINTT